MGPFGVGYVWATVGRLETGRAVDVDGAAQISLRGGSGAVAASSQEATVTDAADIGTTGGSRIELMAGSDAVASTKETCGDCSTKRSSAAGGAGCWAAEPLIVRERLGRLGRTWTLTAGSSCGTGGVAGSDTKGVGTGAKLYG